MKERETAYRCLYKILVEGQYSNLVLRHCDNNTPLVTELVYGTLRNYRSVRQLWLNYVDKKPNNQIAILLDMAVYELVLLDKPAYATVNEIVEIAKKIKKGAYSGMVNAVLRKVKQEDMDNLSENDRLSHPDWLINLWNNHYGKEICQKICQQDLLSGKVSLRVNTLKTTKQQLLRDGNFYQAEVENCLYYKGNIIDTDYFKNNLVMIQSQSSQIAVDTLNVRKNSYVLDLCSAPGSKTVQMAMMMDNTGKIVSNELYDFRSELVRQNLNKYQIKNVELTTVDGVYIDNYYQRNSFDYVLLDAPCSGLGTLRHKPEIKITIKPQDIDEIVMLQKKLLISAANMLKPNGYLVYSTCTLNKKENERQIQSFLAERPDYSLVSQRTIFPFEFDSDGFFVAKLWRNGL